MYINVTLLAIFSLLFSFPTIAQQKENARMVFHIPFDPKLDDPAFSICEVEALHPYYSTNAKNRKDKRELVSYFSTNVKIVKNAESESGFVVIRFIINCQGQTGRFRMESFDKNYQPLTFNKGITDQLLMSTKNLKDWIPGQFENRMFDSYFYFCFKIKNGKLIDVLP
jgi:hypothetical protein